MIERASEGRFRQLRPWLAAIGYTSRHGFQSKPSGRATAEDDSESEDRESFRVRHELLLGQTSGVGLRKRIQGFSPTKDVDATAEKEEEGL